MTTTIASVLMEDGGPVWPPGAWDGLFTVLHVMVVAVSVLSGLLMMGATGKLALDHVRGIRGGCFGEGCWEGDAAALGMVVFLVTGASLAAWAAGPGMGLLTLGAVSRLVVAVGWYIAWRERRTTVALLTAVCGQSGGEQS